MTLGMDWNGRGMRAEWSTRDFQHLCLAHGRFRTRSRTNRFMANLKKAKKAQYWWPVDRGPWTMDHVHAKEEIDDADLMVEL